MGQEGIGQLVYSLRKKIQEIKSQIDAIGEPIQEQPELIASANLIRSNEYLLKLDAKKSELISTYEEYSKSLEVLLSSVFEIQNDLKDILKEQSKLISKNSGSKRKSKSKSKKQISK